MTEKAVRLAAAALLKHYSFDLGGYSTDQLVQHWLDHYPAIWLRMAIVEALYQGRYKAVSVDQILTLWHRRSQPVCHYNHEFERMICNRFPRNLLKDEEAQGLLMLADAVGSDRPVNGIYSPPEDVSELTSSGDDTKRAEADLQTTSNEPNIGSVEDAFDPEPGANERLTDPPTQTSFEPATFAESATPSVEPISRDDAVRQPIHQFVPSGEPPEFYTRMRAASFSTDDFFTTADSVSSFN